jgi:hypothetical protein
MMSLQDLWAEDDELRKTLDPQLAFKVAVDRFIKSRQGQSKPRPVMPAFRGERKTFTQLRDRHLDWVETLGIRDNYNRSDMYDHMMAHYDSMFGPLRRPKSTAVPSDSLRKDFMIAEILNLIELRREEIAANVLPGCLPH